MGDENKHEGLAGYMIFRSDWEALQEIDDPLIRLEIREKMDEFAYTGEWEIDECNPIARLYLKGRKPTLESTINNYLTGKKGGRPKKEETEKKGVSENEKGGFPKNENLKETENKVKYNKGQTDPPTPRGESQSVNVSRSVGLFQKFIQDNISNKSQETLESYEQALGYEVMERAIELTADTNKGYSYLVGILKNKKRNGIDSLAKWDEHEEARNSKKQSEKKSTVDIDYLEGLSEEERKRWGYD